MGLTILLIGTIVELGGARTTSERVAFQGLNAAPIEVADMAPRHGVPVRLNISKINVDADIHAMGLTESGDMESPLTNEHAGWYKYGARPGNEGSAVIAGHLGLNGRAIFSQLSRLKKGDTLSVTDDRQQIATFIVTDIRTYKYDAAPKEVFSSDTGSHLNLITCQGEWNGGQNTYADRLVVFTDRV